MARPNNVYFVYLLACVICICRGSVGFRRDQRWAQHCGTWLFWRRVGCQCAARCGPTISPFDAFTNFVVDCCAGKFERHRRQNKCDFGRGTQPSLVFFYYNTVACARRCAAQHYQSLSPSSHCCSRHRIPMHSTTVLHSRTGCTRTGCTPGFCVVVITVPCLRWRWMVGSFLS